MALGLLIAAGAQVAGSVIKGVEADRASQRRNKILTGIQNQMKPIEQQMDQISQKSGTAIKQIQQQQQSDMDTFKAKEKAIDGQGMADYKTYLHNNGVDSTEDYISKQRSILQGQIDQTADYSIKSAKETFDYESKRQQMANNEELLRVNQAIAGRGIKGSSIANQTISQAVSQETQKMNNLALKFNTSYQDALSTKTQSTEKLTAQLNTEEQSMQTNQMQSFLSYQAEEKQEAFQDMTLNIQMRTTQFQQQMADLKYEETIQQAKLNDLQTQAAIA